MIRTTTSGTLNTYRYQLQRSTYTLNKAQNTVMTGRQFNTFAEEPAKATRAFQLRRSYQRAESQYEAGESVTKKYDIAWSTLDTILSDINQQSESSAYNSIVKSQTDTSGGGRTALGKNLSQLAETIVHTMNNKYGDNYVFSGADGLTIPFTWSGEGDLCYRGISVCSAVPNVETDNNGDPFVYNENGQLDPAGKYYYDTDKKELISIDDYNKQVKDAKTLEYLAKDETKYVDVGLGLEENGKGEIVSSSAADVALQGINYLGYGVDADGDPKNIVCLISRMGTILQNCNSETGEFAEGEREEFYRLAEKFETASSKLSDMHVELDAEAKFLQDNQDQLDSLKYTLNEQITSLEDVDAADAITSLSWAQYCYNAALRTGQSILSQSLMDYLQT